MREIYKTLPSIAPQPHSYGKCRNSPDNNNNIAHFFLADCLDLSTEHPLPDPARLGVKLAELHRRSESPTGEFGFHCTTFDGKLPLTTDYWNPSWTAFFTRLLRDVYALDVRVNGHWQELDDLMRATLETVVPRLLDALTAEGRSIKPCLIHGDLWEGNIGTEVGTGEVYIFDACAYYAHHEKEVAIWRCEHHGMRDEAYQREYFRAFGGPSEPVEEADDRARLYAVETLLIHSAHFPGAETRGRAVRELKALVGKYGGGGM
jgi:fructosamine-3-kinase